MLPLVAENPFPQRDACGLNALHKVLKYHDPGLRAEAIRKHMPMIPKDGLADFELAGLARQLGFACVFGPSPPRDVVERIERRLPVIALVATPGLGGSRSHWVVLHGYDARRRVYAIDWCRDGETGTLGAAVFLNLWRRRGFRVVSVAGRNPSPQSREALK